MGLGFAGNKALTLCEPLHEAVELQKVLVNEVPVLGVIVPVQALALIGWNEKCAVPPVLPNVGPGDGESGEAGPKVTPPDPVFVLPQPVPLMPEAVACRWPGVEPVVTGPVA